MFENARASAVLPAADGDRARAWWKDVFGLEPVDAQPEYGVAVYELAGTRVLSYVTQHAGTAQNTAFAISTDDLDRDMAELRSRGVVFNDYDYPGFTTVDGVAELDGMRTAWFTDSEGNIFALDESP